MRILIDLQGAQTTGSRHRGIGRYSMSLTEAILRERGDHDVQILLNGAFADSIADIRARLGGLVDSGSFHLFYPVGQTRQSAAENSSRRRISELIREAAIASLKPDVVHLTSHFEGFGDEAVSSFHRLPSAAIQSVTLYDLIPLLHRDVYLQNPDVCRWYEERLLQLRRADLLLSISASSGLEAIDHLGFPPTAVVNVGTAADPQFRVRKLSAAHADGIRAKYGLQSRFVMYTGGIDYRKNIESLIGAFARLPHENRRSVSLAIICSCSDADRERLRNVCQDAGLSAKDVVFTGFVPEDDLVDLYNLCELFVFPSWHEGFGLPALEAMHCDAPVIGSDRSSLPEVIGSPDALFDPFDEAAIAAKIRRALTSKSFRSKLVANSRRQAGKFSWKQSARTALKGFEEAFERRHTVRAVTPLTANRPRLAFVSPIPPARSGIADYSAELLPELSRHYEIEVVVPTQTHVEGSADSLMDQFPIRSAESFLAESGSFERVLYHFGNSDHHAHMVELIRNVPGVVVQHDFYLSGLLACMEHVHGLGPLFTEALFESHGYQPLIELSRNTSLEEAMWRYPANRQIIELALGVIVHSDHSKRLGEHWLGTDSTRDWSMVPLLRVRPNRYDRPAARRKIGVEDEFLICSFGGLGATKQSDRLLDAYLESDARRSGRARLVFVGSMPEDEFGHRLSERLRKLDAAAGVSVTGWASPDAYRHYLQSADAAVQLRTLSRGETSAAVLDCLNYGIPTIVNANGSMGDLPHDTVFMLNDEYEDSDLTRAIDALFNDSELRTRLGAQGQELIRESHNPRRCADEYRRAIEVAYRKVAESPLWVARAIASESGGTLGADELMEAAELLEQLCGRELSRTVYVDISQIEGKVRADELDAAIRGATESYLASGVRFEVVALDESARYSTRRKEALRAFGAWGIHLDEQVGRLTSQDEVKVLTTSGSAEHLELLLNNFVDPDLVTV